MQLLENNFENAAIQQLPPNARDLAEHLLTVTPLEKLLLLQQEETPDNKLLTEFNVPEKHWLETINATLLAKTTYFVINPKFTADEVLYLMKIACLSINRPLSIYSVKDVIEMSHDEYPVFTPWLKELARLLKSKTNNQTKKQPTKLKKLTEESFQ